MKRFGLRHCPRLADTPCADGCLDERRSPAKTVETGLPTITAVPAKTMDEGRRVEDTQKVHELRLDCDGDAVVMLIEQNGGIACHTGRESCFTKFGKTAHGRQSMPC